jgi:pyruvate carboxylase
LRTQAAATCKEHSFEEVKLMYTEVNVMFDPLIKVTPSSKVVGDRAIFMATNNWTASYIGERGCQVCFPDPANNFFKGDLRQPVSGFAEKLQKKNILKTWFFSQIVLMLI